MYKIETQRSMGIEGKREASGHRWSFMKERLSACKQEMRESESQGLLSVERERVKGF
jgi:hypothetical protein